ncbi:hypothetical protein [Lonepinella sp. BR2357]|uniref:hypothetical protein n=1 Tax=Lonepinella sp. BR2357 TaxID=3434549 RepID=UPI003F6DCAEE
MSNIRTLINGQEISEIELLRKELERAYIALDLIKTKLGHEGVDKILQEEMHEMDVKFQQFADTCDGELVLSQALMQVDGLKAEDFLKCFRTFSEQTNWKANPEHYMIKDTEGGNRRIIETVGCWDKPVNLIGKFYPNIDNAPAQAKAIRDEAKYPYVSYISCPIREGDHSTAVAAFHQFRNTETGCEVLLGVFMPKGVDQEMIEGHKWHLGIEWRNWARMALEQVAKEQA